jgi:hypothetical protein
MIKTMSFGPYAPRVPTSSPPNGHQIAVAEACETGSYAEVGRQFGITGRRVSMIKERVVAYRQWMADCEAEKTVPRNDRRVEFIGLSTRTRNALKRGGIITVGQMAALSSDAILSMEGAGEAAIAEVQAYLLAND